MKLTKKIEQQENRIGAHILTCEEIKDLCTAFKELRANEYLENLSSKCDNLCTGFAEDKRGE